jgi:hypothetical protein
VITAPELADLRADAVREMPDVVRILRQIEDVLDPVTLVATTAYTVVADDVPAFLTRNLRTAGQAEQGGRPMEHDTYTVVIDPAVVDVRNGDLLDVVASGDAATPTLIVKSITAGSATAGRRLFADRFGDGQTEPIVVIAAGGFGFALFGTQPFGD